MSGSALNPNGKFAPLFLHSVILNANYIDHRNGNGLDNRRANLRAATDLGNVQNMRKRSDVSSIYKGVSWRPDRGKWQVHIRTGGHSKYLGIEVDELEAALLYIWASRKYHGEFGNAKPYTPPIIPICKEKLK
jgi:hypothetical protein